MPLQKTPERTVAVNAIADALWKAIQAKREGDIAILRGKLADATGVQLSV